MRYHVLWALVRKPELIGMFYAAPDSTGLHDLLDSLSEVERADPGFCARMEKIGDFIFADLEKGWRLLDATPVAARTHPLFRLRQAMAYEEDTDYERALPIYLELCESWPDDAAAFGNACDCLIQQGRWTAEVVLGRAPQCYETFHLCHSQRENLTQRTLDCSLPRTAPFRGQPDLGGLLIPPTPLLKSQAIAVSLSEDIEGKEALLSVLSVAA